MTIAHLKALQSAERQMLFTLNPNYFITFCFGYRIKDDSANRHIKQWFNQAQRIQYGPAWAKLFDRPWPVAHCYLEHRDQPNPHKHCLALIPKEMGRWAEVHGEDLWKEIAKRGQLTAKEIYDLPGTIRYCLKDFVWGAGHESVYTYKDTRLKTIGKTVLKVGKET